MPLSHHLPSPIKTTKRAGAPLPVHQPSHSPRVVGLESHAIPAGLDLLQVRRANHPALEDWDFVALACAGVDERERAGAAAGCRPNRSRRGDLDGLEGSSLRLLLFVGVVCL